VNDTGCRDTLSAVSKTRIAYRLSLVACGLVLVAGVASTFGFMRYWHGLWGAAITGGNFHVRRVILGTPVPYGLTVDWHSPAVDMALPSLKSFPSGVLDVVLPLWLVLLLLAVASGYLWHLSDPPIPRGHCQSCGYNLTGNTSGRCPECNLIVPQPIHPRRPASRSIDSAD
jgi:hypothetical protein